MKFIADRRPMKDAPKDKPVLLVLQDASGQWVSPNPFRRGPRGWVSTVTGLPMPTAGAALVGWLPAEK